MVNARTHDPAGEPIFFFFFFVSAGRRERYLYHKVLYLFAFHSRIVNNFPSKTTKHKKMATFDNTNDVAAWKPTYQQTIGEGASCFLCKGVDIAPDYRPTPCGCFACCKKCAMKCATGGKCRLCKQFFTNMTARPINVAVATAAAEAENDPNIAVEEEGEEPLTNETAAATTKMSAEDTAR